MISCSLSSPNTVLDLAALGMASESPLSAAQIVAVVKRVGGARFQPTTDVVIGRLAALAGAGLLTPAPGRTAGGKRLCASEAGRAHARQLLTLRNGAPSEALAAVAACLKICFLDMLDPDERGAVIDDLLAAHRRALGDAQAARASCRGAPPFVRRHLAREVERWEAELRWLEALRILATGRAAA